MTPKSADELNLDFRPATAETWPALEKLFGNRGACGGCWCMWWRLSRSEFNRQKGEGNKKALKTLIENGAVPGILAFLDREAIGWCAIAPRECYLTLERSRVLKRVDDEPVWSVVCLFIAKTYRRRGVSTKLLQAAVKHAAQHGGSIVEGYPVEPKKSHTPDPFAYTGLASAFRTIGFVEVMRRGETRPMMRLRVELY